MHLENAAWTATQELVGMVRRCKGRRHSRSDSGRSRPICPVRAGNHVALECAHAGNLQSPCDRVLAGSHRTGQPIRHIEGDEGQERGKGDQLDEVVQDVVTASGQLATELHLERVPWLEQA